MDEDAFGKTECARSEDRVLVDSGEVGRLELSPFSDPTCNHRSLTDPLDFGPGVAVVGIAPVAAPVPAPAIASAKEDGNAAANVALRAGLCEELVAALDNDPIGSS
jgi:hypothetical protein